MTKPLTDAAIRTAIRQFPTTGKTAAWLADPAPKGAGRLVLRLTANRDSVRAEWFVQQYVGGKRRIDKLGSYPTIGLAEAREKYANRGSAPVTGKATVGHLFQQYVAHLRACDRRTVDAIEKLLLTGSHNLADQLGRNRKAKEVTTADVVSVLQPVFARGKRVYADTMRGYIASAYNWAIRSAHDYTVSDARDLGIRFNPAADIPVDRDARKAGTRWLTPDEWLGFWRWLNDPYQQAGYPYRAVLMLLLLTGQRVSEIASLQAAQWDSVERVLQWDTTKTGKPHLLPVCSRAAVILNSMRPSPEGWLFPARNIEGQHLQDDTLLSMTERYAKRHGLPHFTPRDLRRTWKTLAGEAGLTKTERDLMQNHAVRDVSSRHYDRWLYLPEKRAALVKWDAWVEGKLGAA